ncbi:MAG: DUF1499 domain-containing protein [Lysobacter sp.]
MNACRAVLVLSVIAAALLLVAGPGTRLDWWDFRQGFALMRWAAYAGLAAAVLALAMLLVPRMRRRGGAALVVALLLGLGVAWVPWNGMRQARQVPPIHDISTDTRRPPQFVATLPLRADAPNLAGYGGAEVAKAQAEAYPDLQTRQMGLPPAQAFERALATARDMDWEIVAADPASNRIEATATTLWFGFKDDVVVRVEADPSAPDGDGSRVDVRSVSRVGKSDVGTNAKRIRAYLEMLGN